MNIGWRYPVGRHGPHHFHHMQSKITCHYTKRTTFCKERLCIGRISQVRFHQTIAKRAILIYAVASKFSAFTPTSTVHQRCAEQNCHGQGAACRRLT